MNRRSFLKLPVLAAPAVIGAGVLMPVKEIIQTTSSIQVMSVWHPIDTLQLQTRMLEISPVDGQMTGLGKTFGPYIQRFKVITPAGNEVSGSATNTTYHIDESGAERMECDEFIIPNLRDIGNCGIHIKNADIS